MHNWFEKQWQYKGWAQCILLPLSLIFRCIVAIRRMLYDNGIMPSYSLPVPVVVVGNVTVGGTGKTPLVIFLVEQLQRAGYQPGVISRGYGGQLQGEVTVKSHPHDYGDEPVLIAQRTGVPVWVDPDRVKAGEALLNAYPQCNVIISDDGLQHYRLKRNVEIAVVNLKYSLGNRQLLPAGPLREPISRFGQVDIIVNTSKAIFPEFNCSIVQPLLVNMQLTMLGIFSLHGPHKLSLEAISDKSVVAIAGIGHPERFFDFLNGVGLTCEKHVFIDHHVYTLHDFDMFKDKIILMTEKDAVKCRHLQLDNAWYIPVSAMFPEPTEHQAMMAAVIDRLTKH